jgi:gluconate 2-dehydrogenase alpha chain
VKTLPRVDMVIVGGGWAGLLMAKELGARTALSIVVLERGVSREPEEYLTTMDEVEYAIRMRMVQDPSQETVTLRHHPRQRALPIRQYGSFLPGTGVGGAGEHWTGVSARMLPDCFELHTRTVEKYGEKRLPEGNNIRDWGITYDELEPYYFRAEALMGVSGKAGNLRGKPSEGGNPFEGERDNEYPTRPMKLGYGPELFRVATKSLGYHPYPVPAATISTAYTNPDGVSRLGCVYCGFCDRFGCMIGAKAQPTNTLLPVIRKQKSVTLRARSWVRRIIHDRSAKHDQAGGVVYLDETGGEVFQPADLTILASWTLNNTRLLLLSGIGDPYDPNVGQGTLGRNLTHQAAFTTAAFFEKPLNRFMGAGSSGLVISDFDGDVFDHTKLSFLRGGRFIASSAGVRPIAQFGEVPDSIGAKWGSVWKKAAMHYFDRTEHIGFIGEHLAYNGNFMDLDPNYKDCFGDPLLRLTLNWRDNERKMVEFMAPRAVEIAKAMGAVEVNPFGGLRDYDGAHYRGSHIQGGTIMGRSRKDSVLNPYLQHWDISNLFVLGASSFPQNSSANPTLTVLAQAYRTADVIIERYLKKPASLAS